MIPENNIIVTNRKDLIACGVMLDNRLEHILSSRAKLRLLKTQPWNKDERSAGVFVRYDTFQEAEKHIKRYKKKFFFDKRQAPGESPGAFAYLFTMFLLLLYRGIELA